MKYAIGTLLLLLSAVLNAQEMLQFDNDSQRDLYRSLTAELRCPQCQNQNIADSNAIVAVDMRQKTYELVRQGQERQQVLDYMINRYGDFVHYQPPLNRYTLWLWLSPVLMLTLLLGTAIYRRSKQSQQNVDTQSELNTELDQLIKRYRSKKP
ncbi:cytochrome c-type biogenesis protein [Rheinheimera sp. EpRS3]|uniref:cytochrome c-type biogenesis protein n=1 Tax=Rheinheimera sp. EpRS3 TaxID=1712383 RepID=UPI000748E425|nr:cytochrome c-type biogenesis protein [Rheinheimera sp. EpRS3]KUM52453.1 cytochrome C biogenesis protein [Rheinheimera sp. EpRS3]